MKINTKNSVADTCHKRVARTQKEKRDNSEGEKEVERAAEETIVDSQSSRNNSHGS